MNLFNFLDAKGAGRDFARITAAKRLSDIAAIKANARKMLASEDPNERWVGEYHMSFCAEIELHNPVTK